MPRTRAEKRSEPSCTKRLVMRTSHPRDAKSPQIKSRSTPGSTRLGVPRNPSDFREAKSPCTDPWTSMSRRCGNQVTSMDPMFQSTSNQLRSRSLRRGSDNIWASVTPPGCCSVLRMAVNRSSNSQTPRGCPFVRCLNPTVTVALWKRALSRHPDPCFWSHPTSQACRLPPPCTSANALK